MHSPRCLVHTYVRYIVTPLSIVDVQESMNQRQKSSFSTILNRLSYSLPSRTCKYRWNWYKLSYTHGSQRIQPIRIGCGIDPPDTCRAAANIVATGQLPFLLQTWKKESHEHAINTAFAHKAIMTHLLPEWDLTNVEISKWIFHSQRSTPVISDFGTVASSWTTATRLSASSHNLSEMEEYQTLVCRWAGHPNDQCLHFQATPGIFQILEN